MNKKITYLVLPPEVQWSWTASCVHCTAVVVRLVGSRWEVGVEGQLEQWVWLACVFLGDESSHFMQQLHVELFIGGLEGCIFYGLEKSHCFVNAAIFVLKLEDVDSVCRLRVVVFDVVCVFFVV
jgi:hypothetical protein